MDAAAFGGDGLDPHAAGVQGDGLAGHAAVLCDVADGHADGPAVTDADDWHGEAVGGLAGGEGYGYWEGRLPGGSPFRQGEGHGHDDRVPGAPSTDLAEIGRAGWMFQEDVAGHGVIVGMGDGHAGGDLVADGEWTFDGDLD